MSLVTEDERDRGQLPPGNDAVLLAETPGRIT